MRLVILLAAITACSSPPPRTSHRAQPPRAAPSAVDPAPASSPAPAPRPTPAPVAQPTAVASVPLPEPPPVEPVVEPPAPKITILAARERGEKLWQKLIDATLKEARLEGPADDAPICDGERCRWRLTITYDAGGWRAELGNLDIDAEDGTPTFVPSDGWDRRWTLEEYRVRRADERAALRAVWALPDVKEFCATMKNVHKISCAVHVSFAGGHECEAGSDTNSECMWSIMVSEQHETHTVHWASFVLRPKAWRLEAAVDPGCGKLTVANWRGYRRAWQRYDKSGGSGDTPQCPDGMP